jgi:hypothetical protein
LPSPWYLSLSCPAQFLPQDKVSEFARMNPVQTLQATQEAIGDGELDRQHKLLIETRKVYNQEKKVGRGLAVMNGDESGAQRSNAERNPPKLERSPSLPSCVTPLIFSCGTSPLLLSTLSSPLQPP